MRKWHYIVPTALVALATVAFAHGTTGAKDAPAPKVTPLMQQDLPDYPGKEAIMLLVEHAPGGVTPVHRHDAHAFVYVLEGQVVMGVQGGKDVTLGPGQSFHEGPGDVHTVDRNASRDKPAKFVVVMLKDKDKPPVLPVE